MSEFEKYKGSSKYIASPELRNIVNVTIALGRPLLLKGEPGTGKTLLAHSISESLGKRLIIWNIKSTSKAIDGCYTYDTIQRLNDSRFGSNDRDVNKIDDYIKMGPLGEAFVSDEQVVLLIDEIDKADPEFPNDLLQELDVMSFDIPELKKTIEAKHRPIVIITSNNEKELPNAFLRRCVFHFINFPTPQLMVDIVKVHFPDLKNNLLEAIIKKFYTIRAFDQLKKQPSTSELIDWVGVLLRSGMDQKDIEKAMPFLGVLIKKETDYNYLKKYKENQLGPIQ